MQLSTLCSGTTSSTPVPPLNRRQRSNTSPVHPLSTLKIANTYSSHQVLLTANRQCNKSSQQDDRLGKQEQPNTQSKCSLLSLRSVEKSLLKREASSPVYLDKNTISLASSNDNSKLLSHGSNNHLTRRVVQCKSHRLRSSDSDVTSISSQDENVLLHKQESKETGREAVNIKNRRKNYGQRNKWTKEETEALVRGCNNFTIGQWKAIRDSEPLLAKRSPGDLKDRFRTYFPDAYKQHYPNAKTHISSRVRSVDSEGNPLFGENAIRRERKQFSAEEDAALKRGYLKFGTAWSSIQRDPVLASRKATDLRDRFRNAFPDLYAAAGYKPRSRKATSSSNFYEYLLDPHHQHGSFDAIDLSVFPSHPPRVNSPSYPDQHQLPSLDFLKAHGAEAFSNLRMMSPCLHTNIGENSLSLNRFPTNITPRPSIKTPRPNDTTPRPQKRLTTTRTEDLESQIIGPKQTCPSIIHVKTPKLLQKAQSSMDLTQFSNLHLLDSLDSGFNRDTRGINYSPTFADYLDYGGVSTVPYPDHDFFQSTGSKLTLRSTNTDRFDEGTEPSGVRTLEQGATTMADVINTADWVQELGPANRTFPDVFDVNEFANKEIFEYYDEASCPSSLASSNTSMESKNESAIYTGDIDGLTQINSRMHEFPSSSSGCQSFIPQLSQHESQSMTLLSSQAQQLIQNSIFLQHDLIPGHESSSNHQLQEISMKTPHPHFQSGHAQSYQELLSNLLNPVHFNHHTICSSVNPASDLNSSCSPTSPIYVTSTPLPPSAVNESSITISKQNSTDLESSKV